MRTKWIARGDPLVSLQQAVERLSGETVEDLMFPSNPPSETIKNMTQAAGLIRNAMREDMNITVFGDYDADGICSMAILFLLLKALREKVGSAKDIRVRAPRRLTEGYGISAKAVEEVDDGLLIVVDNGIAAISEIAKAKEKGLTVLVLDHHIPGEELPCADVIVDPHLDNGGESMAFCGAGLSYKLAELLLPDAKDEMLRKKLCSLAAIATIADSVPMKGGNRAVVRSGLLAINANLVTQGLGSIIAACGLSFIDEETIAFKLAPVLNAAGRLYDDGARYVSGCLAQDTKRMDSLAQKLVAINEERKLMVKDARGEAVANLAGDYRAPLVCHIDGKYEGVAGIVAGKLSEEYGVPAYVVSGKGDLKGSGRSSLEQVNLYELTGNAQDLLVRYGGHAGAVGISLREENLEAFRDCLVAAYEKLENGGEQGIPYDLEISAEEVLGCIKEQAKYAPFGCGAPKPVFLIRDIPLFSFNNAYVRYMGKESQHIKFKTKGYSLVGFDMADRYEEEGRPTSIHVVGTVGMNESSYGSFPQVQIIDFVNAER